MSDHYSHPDPTVRELLELLAAAYEQGKKDAALEFISAAIGDESKPAGMYQ